MPLSKKDLANKDLSKPSAKPAGTAMTWVVFLRSALFHLLFYTFTALVCLLLLPTLLLPYKVLQVAVRFWARASLKLFSWIVGGETKIHGANNLPERGGYVVISNHQSFWDIVFFLALFNNAAFVMKVSLAFIPFFGWYCIKLKMPTVDRSKGASALRKMRKESQLVIKAHRTLVIFPQGSRIAPEEKVDYKSGVADMYKNLSTLFVPVAHNSGYVWPRRGFLRYRGTIDVRILQPLAQDLPPRVFLKQAQQRIEDACDTLGNSH